jgi:hypothetical protein
MSARLSFSVRLPAEPEVRLIRGSLTAGYPCVTVDLGDSSWVQVSTPEDACSIAAAFMKAAELLSGAMASAGSAS